MQQSADMYKAAKEKGGQFATYGLFISTVKGNKFYIDKPVFDIEEIGHTLGHLCRYGGHCRTFYSVAEHSLLVAAIMDALAMGDPFEGLLHDGHEGYFVDLPSPWKALLPEYRALENRLELALRKQYGLPDETTAACKFADWVALAIESRQLLASKGNDFLWPAGVREEAAKFINYKVPCWKPEIARDHFLAAFCELGGPRGYKR